jgi:hypothetical protein
MFRGSPRLRFETPQNPTCAVDFVQQTAQLREQLIRFFYGE